MKARHWIIVDTETSGLSAPVYAVEIAAQRMLGWQRDGEPFRVLLNHDVPIDPMAEAVHGYSREFLRKRGQDPIQAYDAFRAYAGEAPLVAYNLRFDWHRVLVPEYERLGIPIIGAEGFCALTLSRRAIPGMPNYKLETLKNRFQLSAERSHRGSNDVEILTRLFENILHPVLEKSGLTDWDEIRTFSRYTPVAHCHELVQGPPEPVWYYLDRNDTPQGPYSAPILRTFLRNEVAFVWRDTMRDWKPSSDVPELKPFLSFMRKRKTKTSRTLLPTPPAISENGPQPEVPALPAPVETNSLWMIQYEQWTNELIGLCRGIVADGVINDAEFSALRDWLGSCPCPHLYPASTLSECVERIVANGPLTSETLSELRDLIYRILPSSRVM